MQTELKTRAFDRISAAALVVALLAGVTIGGVMIGAQDDKPEKETTAAPPPPRRTAYVDFLSLLKTDRLLLGEQQAKGEDMQRMAAEIDKKFGVKVQAQARIRDLNKPDSIAYREAMKEQLELERQRYQEKLLVEQLTQADLRDFAIKRFKALRNLAASIAKAKEYNEVLNIVQNIDDVTGGQNDFQALQQQLLVSPVLYFETAHDITAEVEAKAKERWGETISFVTFDAEKKTGGVKVTIEGAAVERNAEDEIEIRLGQKGEFAIEVLDKGAAAKDKRAKVKWSARGINIGELGEGTGAYEAPDKRPPGGDVFTVTVRSVVDPTISETVKIRLLDKDGNPLPPKGN